MAEPLRDIRKKREQRYSYGLTILRECIEMKHTLPPAGEEGEEKENREGAMPMISETPPFRYARVCKEGPVFDARKIFWD